nr:MAG TPA: hypothetical protein [Caudoviricetes sp.]
MIDSLPAKYNQLRKTSIDKRRKNRQSGRNYKHKTRNNARY